MTLVLAVYVGGMRTMNRSKLFEWLLDNECPFEWDVDDFHDDIKSCKLIFTEEDQWDE